MQNLTNYVEFISIALAIVGLLIALREGKRARIASARANEEYKNAVELAKEYGKLVDEYNRLVGEYKGQILSWEDLVNELANQVSGETESIWLAIDTLPYGIVTVPSAHRKFWGELLKKATALVPIQIVTFNEEAQVQMVKEQFGNEMAAAPTTDIKRAMEEHFEYIKTLKQSGKEAVDITVSSYFPLHLFIFKGNGVAIFALLELFGDEKVRAHAIRTRDPTLIEICRQTFIKMKKLAPSS